MYSERLAAGQQSAAADNQAPSLRSTMAPRDKSSLDMAFDELSMRVNDAEVNLERLGDKLKPVMRQTNACGKENGPSPSANCELEDRILQLAHRVSCIGDGIGSLTNQVCL